MKLKPQGKYNFLLIHDDGATKSFRISRTLIRFLLMLSIVLPIVGGGGAWIGWKAWEREKVWDEEERALQNELISLRMQLNRLSHIERLIQEHESGLRADAAAASVVVPSQPIVPQSSAETAAQPSAGTAPALPAATSASAPVDDSPRLESPPAAVAEQPSAEEAAKYPVLDSDMVRLDNVSVLLVDGRRLRVRMDLHNESGRQVAGKVLLFILTPDGQRTELAYSDSAFRISRLKKFAVSSVVPDSVGNLTNASLLVEVADSNSALLSRQLYPIAD